MWTQWGTEAQEQRITVAPANFWNRICDSLQIKYRDNAVLGLGGGDKVPSSPPSPPTWHREVPPKATPKCLRVTWDDVTFLTFFFTRLERNRSGRYEREFPFVSRCGAERNLLRCEHRPIVFTRLLPPDASSSASSCSRRAVLSFCGGGERLAVPFRPEALVMLPENGRLYHPAPGRAGGAGPVRSALALEWGSRLEYEQGPEQPPTHFWWEGKRYRLTGELVFGN
ncbi:LOW QUALITY PROTEIN: UPF0598 protein C8orf82 homolog [Colius striatus]|uniref:LOW QUALITY PROTEIN: UPF0598 protein C8orf82 homolog n=1 Tax=Colius striatus TaxID=57412 RepID=UPI002B1CFA65|nr:LOW QUALITY PROTEIN: UPF0598 protein C8orf82 homolog [Colius striatus]